MRKFPKTFTDILTIEHRWPKKGDQLLKGSLNFEEAAHFADPHSRDALLWVGYMTAGAALVDEAGRRPQDRNELIYPILFNYRHGLELAMKWIIDYYGSIADVSLKNEDRNHDLLTLWRMCRKIMEAVGHGEDEATDAVERVVKDFHNLDKSGMSMRYAFNKNGEAIVLRNGLIDLGNIQQVMEGVEVYFTGSDGLLSDLITAAPSTY